jgi:hypothetical protein
MPMLREDSMMGPVREQKKIAVRRIDQRARRRGGEREERRRGTKHLLMSERMVTNHL